MLMQHSVIGPNGANDLPKMREPSVRAPLSASTNAPE
jgi:hypothetical protein